MTTQEGWRLDDAAAEFYEASFVPALFAAWAPILAEMASVKYGQTVLDVGCGTGIVARTIVDQVGGRGKVIGYDLNPSMINVARGLRGDIEWRVGDVERMPFRHDSFDVVLCQAALMFFQDRVAGLREMRRVTTHGGRISVLVFGESPGYETLGQVIGQVAGPEAAAVFMAPFSLADPSDVTPLFAAAGYGAIEVEARQGTARFPSIESLIQTEIDGWVLRGHVDAKAVLAAARPQLLQYCDERGAVTIPLEAFIYSSTK